MGQGVYSAAIALLLGAVAGLLLFVPFIALSYRRRGRLSFGRVLVWIAAIVYFMAIWSYTLLPFPDPSEHFECVAPNMDLGTLYRDLDVAFSGAGNPFVTAQFLQLALNVLLFVPLGFFVRVLGGRGVFVSLLAGLALSAIVETTQLTGALGVFPCAYRMFDVVDLVTNTAGALIGSLLALAVPRTWRQVGTLPNAAVPRRVTRGRRLLAMSVDLVAYVLFGWSVAIGVQVWLMYVVGNTEAVRDGSVADTVSLVVPPLLWLVVILSSGQSIGDAAVLLRYRGGRFPKPLARLLRALGGVVGYALIGLIPVAGGALQFAFAVLALVLVLSTRSGRGLPGLLSGQQLADAREVAKRDHSVR